jgi:phosphohistidine phosphatase SixA
MRNRWRRRTPAGHRSILGRLRSLPAAVIPLLVAVAVLGYVAGRSRSHDGSAEGLRTARSAHVLIRYPVGWKLVSGGVGVPGLSIVHPQLIVAGSPATRAGLIVGTLPPGELGPLPRPFLSRLLRLPQTAVVDLAEGQAYRYTQFSGPGLQEPLAVFVIPNPDGAPTALACYAPSLQSPYMRACEQTVSGVTVVGQSQPYQLTPQPGYAAQISSAIASLDHLRGSLKSELQPQVSAERAQLLTERLARGFAQAAAALSRVEPAPAAAQVQAALASSIARARDGYTSLASAAGGRDAPAYKVAQKRVLDAEADVDRTLQAFVLLGYGPALGQPAGAS